MISAKDIEDAALRIAPYVRVTPVMALEPHAWDVPGQLVLKLEQTQFTGSFKARGAFNRLLSLPVPASGVIAASGGNHGVAVAYAAQRLGYQAEIFVPEISSPVKVERLRHYGARVFIVGASYAEALQASELRARETGALVVHAFDQPEVVAGQGTVGRELARQDPQLDTVLVAVGGGGLISGIASWYAGSRRVVGVEPMLAPTLTEALRVGQQVDVAVSGVAADSLGAKRAGEIAFATARRYVDHTLLVHDDAIRRARAMLWQDLRLLVEPAGAVALAALLEGAYRPAADERVGIVLCGGNTLVDL